MAICVWVSNAQISISLCVGIAVCVTQSHCIKCYPLSVYYHTVAEEILILVEAKFNDTRCDGDGVCSNDPLLFTCAVYGSLADHARIVLSSQYWVELDQFNNTRESLPPGIFLHWKNAIDVNGTGNFFMVLAIKRVSLLNGNAIMCNSESTGGSREAKCPVATGKQVY